MSEPTTKPSAAAIKCAEELIRRKDLVDVPMNVPAVELAEVIEAHMKPLRGALQGVFDTIKESKKMRVEFPPGTCNAEDAWRDFGKREEEAWACARRALKSLK